MSPHHLPFLHQFPHFHLHLTLLRPSLDILLWCCHLGRLLMFTLVVLGLHPHRSSPPRFLALLPSCRLDMLFVIMVLYAIQSSMASLLLHLLSLLFVIVVLYAI